MRNRHGYRGGEKEEEKSSLVGEWKTVGVQSEENCGDSEHREMVEQWDTSGRGARRDYGCAKLWARRWTPSGFLREEVSSVSGGVMYVQVYQKVESSPGKPVNRESAAVEGKCEEQYQR